jgi:hypothetical protein
MRTWSGRIRSGLLSTSRLRSKISGQRLASPSSRWAMPDVEARWGLGGRVGWEGQDLAGGDPVGVADAAVEQKDLGPAAGVAELLLSDAREGVA